MLTPPKKKPPNPNDFILFYFLTWELFQKQNQGVIFFPATSGLLVA